MDVNRGIGTAAQDRRSGWSSAEGPGRKVWGMGAAVPPATSIMYGVLLATGPGFVGFDFQTDGDPSGWVRDLDYLVTAPGEGYPGQHVYVGHGPIGNVLTATTGGAGALGNSYCLYGFTINNYSGLAAPVVGHSVVGTLFVWPNVIMPGAGLLIAPMTRRTSAEPWQDPNAPDWSNVTPAPEGTSTTSVTLTGGADKVLTTQAGLSYAGGTVQISSAADPTNAMIGAFVSYVGATLTLHPLRYYGSGTHTDWNLGHPFFDEQALGDRQLVNCQYQAVTIAGTYGGQQGPPEGVEGGDTNGVVVIPLNGTATIARRGSSGNGSGAQTVAAALFP